MEKKLNEIDNFLEKVHFERYNNPNFYKHISGRLNRMTQIHRNIVTNTEKPTTGSLSL